MLLSNQAVGTVNLPNRVVGAGLPVAEPSASGVDIDLRDRGSERLSDGDVGGSVDLHMCIVGMLRIGRTL